METRLGAGSALLLCFICGCASRPKQPATSDALATVKVTGSQGAAVRGFFIADGKRSEFSASLPMMLRIQDMTLVAIGKTRPSDQMTVSAYYPNGNLQFNVSPNDPRAALIQLSGGYSGSYIPMSALNAPGNPTLVVINPYWYKDTWVFDDSELGLTQEPFVQGVPEMINFVVKDIPDAKSGFRLIASEKPFPGYTNKLTWVRAESGGNYYRLENTQMEGWLCPALFRYFDHAPATLYIEVEPRSPASPAATRPSPLSL